MAKLRKNFKRLGIYRVFSEYLSGNIEKSELAKLIEAHYDFQVDNKISDGYIKIILDSADDYCQIFDLDDDDFDTATRVMFDCYKEPIYSFDVYDSENEFAEGRIFAYYFNNEDFEPLIDLFGSFDRYALKLLEQAIESDRVEEFEQLAAYMLTYHGELSNDIIFEFSQYNEEAINEAGNKELRIEICSWLEEIPTAIWGDSDNCPTIFYMKIEEIVKQYDKYFAGRENTPSIVELLKKYNASGGLHLHDTYYQVTPDEELFKGFHNQIQYEINKHYDNYTIRGEDDRINIIDNLISELETSKLEFDHIYILPGGNYNLKIIKIDPDNNGFVVKLLDITKNKEKTVTLTIDRIKSLLFNYRLGQDEPNSSDGFSLIQEFMKIF